MALEDERKVLVLNDAVATVVECDDGSGVVRAIPTDANPHFHVSIGPRNQEGNDVAVIASDLDESLGRH